MIYIITKDRRVGNITNPQIKPAVESPLRRHPLGVHSRLRNTSLWTLFVPYRVSISIRTIANKTTKAPKVAAPSSGEIQTSTVVGLNAIAMAMVLLFTGDILGTLLLGHVLDPRQDINSEQKRMLN